LHLFLFFDLLPFRIRYIIMIVFIHNIVLLILTIFVFILIFFYTYIYYIFLIVTKKKHTRHKNVILSVYKKMWVCDLFWYICHWCFVNKICIICIYNPWKYIIFIFFKTNHMYFYLEKNMFHFIILPYDALFDNCLKYVKTRELGIYFYCYQFTQFNVDHKRF